MCPHSITERGWAVRLGSRWHRPSVHSDWQKGACPVTATLRRQDGAQHKQGWSFQMQTHSTAKPGGEVGHYLLGPVRLKGADSPDIQYVVGLTLARSGRGSGRTGT